MILGAARIDGTDFRIEVDLALGQMVLRDLRDLSVETRADPIRGWVRGPLGESHTIFTLFPFFSQVLLESGLEESLKAAAAVDRRARSSYQPRPLKSKYGSLCHECRRPYPAGHQIARHWSTQEWCHVGCANKGHSASEAALDQFLQMKAALGAYV